MKQIQQKRQLTLSLTLIAGLLAAPTMGWAQNFYNYLGVSFLSDDGGRTFNTKCGKISPGNIIYPTIEQFHFYDRFGQFLTSLYDERNQCSSVAATESVSIRNIYESTCNQRGPVESARIGLQQDLSIAASKMLRCMSDVDGRIAEKKKIPVSIVIPPPTTTFVSEKSEDVCRTASLGANIGVSQKFKVVTYNGQVTSKTPVTSYDLYTTQLINISSTQGIDIAKIQNCVNPIKSNYFGSDAALGNACAQLRTCLNANFCALGTATTQKAAFQTEINRLTDLVNKRDLSISPLDILKVINAQKIYIDGGCKVPVALPLPKTPVVQTTVTQTTVTSTATALPSLCNTYAGQTQHNANVQRLNDVLDRLDITPSDSRLQQDAAAARLVISTFRSKGCRP